MYLPIRAYKHATVAFLYRKHKLSHQSLLNRAYVSYKKLDRISPPCEKAYSLQQASLVHTYKLNQLSLHTQTFLFKLGRAYMSRLHIDVCRILFSKAPLYKCDFTELCIQDKGSNCWLIGWYYELIAALQCDYVQVKTIYLTYYNCFGYFQLSPNWIVKINENLIVSWSCCYYVSLLVY